ncbi:N-formylglutamate amidohydrolase [Zavarzinia sp. CC-PAN008]|uniref:N-formylglutamate amidohydrolase n=1 Tax=Zavarzinia sp. CC-PAN008 TaxID=3243332 RepID=UPI003F743291
MSVPVKPQAPITRLARLLGPDDPAPYSVERAAGTSPFVLTCDHAGKVVPRRLGTLGLPQAELDRHIGWDIGAAGVTRRLAAGLDAFAILSTYSRLVIDANRDPAVPSSIATISELTEVPGNVGLVPDERAARIVEVFEPYHNRIAAELDQRQAAGRPTILVAVHSFTPVFKGVARAWHAGVLYNRMPALPHAVLAGLRAEPGLVVGDNEPYAVSDATDYTVPVHGERRALPHVEIEIRQDLIAGADGQAEWAERLQRVLVGAAASLGLPH